VHIHEVTSDILRAHAFSIQYGAIQRQEAYPQEAAPSTLTTPDIPLHTSNIPNKEHQEIWAEAA
jgi:hypothetical protein